MAELKIKHKAKLTVKRKITLLVVILLLVGGSCAGYLYYHNTRQNPADERAKQLGLVNDEVTNSDKNDHHLDSHDKPRFLTIESANVNQARIQEIGLLAPSSDGSQQMDAPKNINDVGWYNCQINPLVNKRCSEYSSPAGGNTKTAAVIDGHSCSGDGCVFDNLTKLKQGDKIVIELESGSKVEYLVDAIEVVKLADLDMNKAMRPYQINRPGLNLITCDGNWTTTDSNGVRSMDKRVVVYSTMR